MCIWITVCSISRIAKYTASQFSNSYMLCERTSFDDGTSFFTAYFLCPENCRSVVVSLLFRVVRI